MERIQSTRFSFRRKGSRHKDKEVKDKEATSTPDFDYEKLTYLSQKDSKSIFQDLISEYSFSVDQLLELAGFSCAVAIAKTYQKDSLTKGKGSLLVCCGPGKNGATGLVCARHLKLFGYKPTVFYPKRPTGNALYSNLAEQCQKSDIPFLLYLPSEAQLVADSYNIVIDAIFGVGYQPPMTSDFTAIVQTVIRSKVPVVSIDVPSGWEVDDTEPTTDSQLQPEMLISLMSLSSCSRHFTGRQHVLAGRFLPVDLTKKYELYLPPFSGTDVIVELLKRPTIDNNKKVVDGGGSGVGGTEDGGQASRHQRNDEENWEC